MSRGRRIVLTVLALAFLQGTAVLVFLWVDRGRRHEPASSEFEYRKIMETAPGQQVLLERADGSTVALRSYLASPLLLHFWATWCKPCATELPTLLELAQKNAHGLQVLLVSVDENWETVRHFFHGNIPESVVRDRGGTLKAAYQVSTLPHTYVLRRDGVMLAAIRGARDWSTASARHEISRWAGVK